MLKHPVHSLAPHPPIPYMGMNLMNKFPVNLRESRKLQESHWMLAHFRQGQLLLFREKALRNFGYNISFIV